MADRAPTGDVLEAAETAGADTRPFGFAKQHGVLLAQQDGEPLVYHEKQPDLQVVAELRRFLGRHVDNTGSPVFVEVREAVGRLVAHSAADLAHRTMRTDEVHLPNLVAGPLGVHATGDLGGSRGPRPQQRRDLRARRHGR